VKNKPLWDVFDGEPFMENPQLGILGLNPKRKRGSKMAVRRRRRVHRRGRKSTTRRTKRHVSVSVKANPRRRRRSRRRSNWLVSGAVSPFTNPRRRHRRSARKNRVHHRRRHARRNPAFMGFSLPPLKSVLFAGVGFAGPSMVSGFLSSTFPSIMSQTTSMGVAGKYLVKIGSVLGLAWLTRRFVGSNEANMVMVGGAANVALSLANDFAPGFLPANPLSAYVPTSMAGMAGMKSYVGLKGLRGGLQAPLAVGAGLVMNRAAAVSRNGSYGGVAQRYFRY
jgi:hypothetical protein